MKIKNFKILCGAIACTVLLYGCTSMPQVEEAKVDMELLAGKWEGEYSSTATQRSGKVFLDLTSTANNARGGIIMHPTKSERASSSMHGKITYGHQQRPKAVPLSIDFVQAEGATIKGNVTPYQDPRFNSTMYTTFEGTIEGATMKGTFTVKIGQSGNSYTGTWWATRK